VVQTGVQLLTGFLLTLPFQQRFAMLDEKLHLIGLLLLGAAVSGVATMVFEVIAGRQAGLVAGLFTATDVLR
jgi:hypothetical protein